MIVSTKGRYALRVMIDLAEHPSDGYIPLREIAQRPGDIGKVSRNHPEIVGTWESADGASRQRRRVPAESWSRAVYGGRNFALYRGQPSSRGLSGLPAAMNAVVRRNVVPCRCGRN